MTATGQLERRVGVVEEEVNEVREMAQAAVQDVVQLRNRQAKVLNALRETQVEHGKTLEKHSTALAELRQTQLEHSVILGAHTQVLDGHTKALDGHTKILNEHTKTLAELAGGQRLIMRHLGISAEESTS